VTVLTIFLKQIFFQFFTLTDLMSEIIFKVKTVPYIYGQLTVFKHNLNLDSLTELNAVRCQMSISGD